MKFIIYEENTSLFLSVKNYNEISRAVNVTMKSVDTWAKSDNVIIINKKTKAILYCSKNRNPQLTSDIILDSSPIEVVTTFKTLRGFFSKHVDWTEHADYIISELSRITGLLHGHRHGLPKGVTLLLHNSLFLSHLNYCNLVWGTTTKSNLQKLFLYQKIVLRIVCNVPYNCHTHQIKKNCV